MAKKKNILRAVIGFIGLSIFFVIIHMIDFAVMYSIFLYIQFLLAPFMTGIGYLFYVVRSSIPYIFMYFLICLFFNLQTYRRNSTIKIFKYTVDLNAVKKSKIYIYIRQYNYLFIITLNLFLLFIVYYAYMHNKYFYLLFVFLFYLFIWIVIKVKQLLLKNETFQYKKVHMLVNLTLILLVGTYISMAIDELHIFNFRLYGFENFWKLIDNKFFIKMPSKDYNWHRLFNWSKQVSTDRYVYAVKKGLIKSEIFEQNSDDLISEDKLSLDSNIIKEKALLPLNSLNNESHVNVNITDYLNRVTNDNYNLSKFSNAFYQKFKKIFLIQSQIKPSIFIPTPEISERQKLFTWLKNSNNIIDLSDLYLTTDTDDALYNNYLDLVDQKFKNLTTKKVFLITLHKNYYNLKSFAFFADFEDSFKKNYALFLNSDKNSIDLKNNSSLNFEYYNSDFYLNFDLNNLLQKLKSELYIIFKENEIALSLFTQKFKSLYSIKTFKFSFKGDILTERDHDLISELKPKSKKLIMIPDFKKLQVWKTFKLNYKEILYNHTKELRLRVAQPIMSSENWFDDNQLQINKEPLNEIFFIVEDDIAYSLKDNILTQVENLTFGETNNEAELLSEFISHYLENIKGRSKAIELISKKKFTKILINDVEKAVVELQNKKVHVPMFNSMYHEIMHQNSNDFFKCILEKFDISRDLLTSTRSFMTYDMWCTVMHKLLNLNINSIWLQNLTDYNNSLHSDATDDLQYNFSLAFELLQNKYDTTKLQIIPDLDGIPGTFFEYTVKYNAHMARYYWYEEQEAIIDWIYEIAYYSLVNIMDSVKVVNDKENDFLYDFINLYKREMKFKWIAESFEEKTRIFIEPTKNLNLLNRKIQVLNDLAFFSKHKNDLLLSNNISLQGNESMMDFSNIKNIHDLNAKTFRDLSFFKKAFEWEHSKLVRAYPSIADYFHEVQHTDMHSNEFELMLQYYTQEQQKLNWELSITSGVAMDYPEEPEIFWEAFIDYLVDDYFETQNLNKLDYLFEELNSEMQIGYDHLLEMEEFEDAYVEDAYALYDEFHKVLIAYQATVKKAEFMILNKMLGQEVDNKIIVGEEKAELLEFNEYDIELALLKCIELRSMELDSLPIYDFHKHAMIEENIQLLAKDKPDVLLSKMAIVDKQLADEKTKLLEMKKAAKEYRIQLIKNAMEKPETKRYLENDWDRHNYLANKTDKFMRDWYKNGKKR